MRKDFVRKERIKRILDFYLKTYYLYTGVLLSITSGLFVAIISQGAYPSLIFVLLSIPTLLDLLYFYFKRKIEGFTEG